MLIRNAFCRTVKLQRRTRGTFMSALSNESFSHYLCAEVTLPFSAVAQRLYPMKTDLQNLNLELPAFLQKVLRKISVRYHNIYVLKTASHYLCAEVTLPFSAVAQRLKIGGIVLKNKVQRFGNTSPVATDHAASGGCNQNGYQVGQHGALRRPYSLNRQRCCF